MDSAAYLDMAAGWLNLAPWVVQVFAVVFATLLIDFVQKRVLARLHAGLARTENYWDDSLVEAMRRPATLLIWVVGLSFAAEIVEAHTGAVIFRAVPPIRTIGVIVALTWFLVRFINLAQQNIVARRRAAGEEVDITTVDAIGKLLRLSVIITASLVALQSLGFSVSGVLAFGGVGGVAVGFAARDLLANFFGGLMVYLDRPFAVGDWIRSPDRDIEGVVERIGWRSTVIRTFDKRPLYVPNATFTQIAVENPSRMSNRRIYETVGIRYDDAHLMEAIVRDVREMLRSHPEIDTTQTLIVNFNRFAASSLDFFIYTFTRTTEWVRYHEIKEDVLLKVLAIIERHGAEVAFPTRTVHLRAGEPPQTAGLEPGALPAGA